MASKPAEVVDIGADGDHHRAESIVRLGYDVDLTAGCRPQGRLDIADEHRRASSQDDVVAAEDDDATVGSDAAAVTDSGPAAAAARLDLDLERGRRVLGRDFLLAQPR